MFPPAEPVPNRPAAGTSGPGPRDSHRLFRVAALAYLLLPISGAIAYFGARTPRVRVHGLQATVLGALWPAAMYAATLISPGVTQAVFVAMGSLWIVVMVTAAVGRDLWLPGLGRVLNRLSGPGR